MRKLFPLFAVTAMVAGLTLIARAEDGKEVTLKGDGVCAKCALKEAPKCQNVLVVKDGDKETKYYLAKNTVSDEAHQALGICTAKKASPAKLKVVGTVKEEDGKQILTATKIEKDGD